MAEALPPFQAFLDEHLQPVRAFLRGMVGPHDAEDCLQETFLAALRAYPRAEATNLRAWIFTIARRKAIDHHRSRSRQPQPVAEPQEVIDRQARAPGGPRTPLGMSPRHSAIWAAVAELPRVSGRRSCCDSRSTCGFATSARRSGPRRRRRGGTSTTG